MNPGRIKAVMLHSWYHLNHSVETWVDLFWFSLINVFVFGLITMYFIQGGGGQQVNYMLLGLILWGVLYVGQYSITVGALWEIWSRSFTTLFISPLTLGEFIVGHMLGGVMKSLAVFLVTAVASSVLYDFSIFGLGWFLIILVIELLIFSWSSGIFILALILRFGTTIQSLAWGLIFLVQPLSAVFFPVEVLPSSIRWISFGLPVTYVFEAARDKLTHGFINWPFILVATVLNAVFLAASIWFVQSMLARGKKTGSFARMEN
jgi:ABC-2 type transport system permease protein